MEKINDRLVQLEIDVLSDPPWKQPGGSVTGR